MTDESKITPRDPGIEWGPVEIVFRSAPVSPHLIFPRASRTFTITC